MKTIWIINQYASTPENGYAGRHYYLGTELVKLGYKVYLIASAKHHLLREKVVMDSTFKITDHDGLNVVWMDMPTYADAHSKQRVLNWFIFSWKLLRLVKLIPDKPEYILCSSPSLISFFGAKKLAKQYKSKLIFEVRDIWPLTLTEIGGFSSKNLFIRFLQWVENKAYRDSDAVVSNLKNSVEHMVVHGLNRDKFTWIPNGFSEREVREARPLADNVLSQVPIESFIVGYTGTFGLANDLYTLLAAAAKLKKYPEIKFVLVGGGKEKSNLINYSKELELNNVIFINFINKNHIQSMLKCFDVLTVGAKKEPMYHFGVSPNKLFDYMIAGKPIIYHIESGNYHPVTDAGCGFEVESGDPDKLANAILKVYKMPPNEREFMGDNGVKAALHQYEYRQLAEKLVQVLRSM
ncbi:glycosyltransferase family 4 protein [Nitrincola sp. A-D6]|uniref:glycosyltransferase family 4 protein n=1 Tax=Nitrincola sp. A-D6 TaxID=1545442 RepID=UPI000A9B0624|nr:glycosyltransferase family 4 protein [Nitrincola sp. A-D6]